MATPSRRNHLVNLYRRRLTPFLNDDYSSVDNLVDRLLEADPEGGKNGIWILDNFINRQFLLEDISRVRADIEQFNKDKIGLPVKDRVLSKYTYSQLKEVLDRLRPQIRSDLDTSGDVTVLYDGPLGTLAIPRTEEASCILGKGTKWCTAATQSDNMFESYKGGGDLYVWMDRNRGRKKFQFWFAERNNFENPQFMDELDNVIEREDLSYFMFDNPITSQIFRRMEERALQDPYWAVSYALRVLQEPWGKAEPIILQNGQAAADYAAHVLKGPWPEAEPIIMTSPHGIVQYAANALKRRWPKAEQAVLAEPFAAARYATDVIKGKWPEGYRVISSDPVALTIYSTATFK